VSQRDVCKNSQNYQLDRLENVAIANALQLEATRATPVLFPR